MSEIRMVTEDEVFEAQGEDHNIIHFEGGPHALMAVPMDLIYENDRGNDPLDDLGYPEHALKLADDLRSGRVRWQDMTPVIVHPYKKWIWLGDGHHRFVAHLLTNQTHIMAFVPESLIERMTR